MSLALDCYIGQYVRFKLGIKLVALTDLLLIT